MSVSVHIMITNVKKELLKLQKYKYMKKWVSVCVCIKLISVWFKFQFVAVYMTITLSKFILLYVI